MLYSEVTQESSRRKSLEWLNLSPGFLNGTREGRKCVTESKYRRPRFWPTSTTN